MACIAVERGEVGCGDTIAVINSPEVCRTVGLWEVVCDSVEESVVLDPRLVDCHVVVKAVE